jgi:hypothetical protein
MAGGSAAELGVHETLATLSSNGKRSLRAVGSSMISVLT